MHYLSDILDQLAKKRGFPSYRIFKYWPEIIGKNLAQLTVPHSLRYQEKDYHTTAIMTITAHRLSVLEVQYSERFIVERLRSHLERCDRLSLKILSCEDLVNPQQPLAKEKRMDYSLEEALEDPFYKNYRTQLLHLKEELRSIEGKELKKALQELGCRLILNNGNVS